MFGKLKRFRFHLSTALVLMLLAAGANWYYVKHYLNVPEPWEVAIRKKLTEVKITGDYEADPAMAFRCTGADAAPVMVSKKIWGDKKQLPYKISDLTCEQALNQLCEKFHTKWTIQQGVIFICARDEEFPTWKSYDADLSWSVETRAKLCKRFRVCYKDNELLNRMKFYRDICHIPIIVDPAYKNLTTESVMVASPDMKMEHALHWACYYGDAEWCLRKNNDGKEEIYVTSKKPASITATSPSAPNATPLVSQK
jgi:hypothetical protein